MTRKSNIVPPLDASELPWTDAELHFREAQMSHEEVAPEAIESAVFASLDATNATNATHQTWRRGAVLAVGAAALVAVFWSTKEPSSSTLTAPVVPAATLEVQPEIAVQPETVAAARETPAESNEDLRNETNASADTPRSDEVVGAKLETLVNMKGLSTTELEGGYDGERVPLQTESSSTTTVRKEATLEVKQ